MTHLLIILLAIIAAIVAYGLHKKQLMWRWIVAYWIVLTVKNVLDLMAQ